MAATATKRRLFDVASKKRWTGSRALVPISPHVCPACGFVLDACAVGQLSLFFHGGYGATEETTRRYCHSCGWSMVAAVDSRNPRRRSAA